jgi:hypothetical protein
LNQFCLHIVGTMCLHCNHMGATRARPGLWPISRGERYWASLGNYSRRRRTRYPQK